MMPEGSPKHQESGRRLLAERFIRRLQEKVKDGLARAD